MNFPQYIFTVPEDGHKVIMSLQQKDLRTYRQMGRPDNYIIGFELFKVKTAFRAEKIKAFRGYIGKG